MDFTPDYRLMLQVMANQRPERLPIYEHFINATFMEKYYQAEFAALEQGDEKDLKEFFRYLCGFFREMTYDTISYEVCITEILPEHGAILGGRGPIQTRQDFERYPWDELEERYWQAADRRFQALAEAMPASMKAQGGVGNGVLEISEDLVGYEYLAYMQADDPELFTDLYNKIGGLMEGIWRSFLPKYGDVFVICRFGDDLGFKTSTLLSPRLIRQHIFPQYKRIIHQVRQSGHPFLWHSCGNIFPIMDEVIAMGINAKHSNEDIIAPFERWIELYNDRIALLGGIDVDILCRKTPDEIYAQVLEQGRRYRRMAKGFALGSGNSIPDYIPVDGYLAMIRASQKLRQEEAQ